MKRALRILILEDNPSDVILIKRELRKINPEHESVVIQDREGLYREIRDFKPELILSDYSMPKFTGMEALEIAKQECPEIPFIIVTGSVNEETAVKCMRHGAWDYVIKDKLVHLGHAVLNAMKLKEENEKDRQAKEELHASEEKFRLFAENVPGVVSIYKWYPGGGREFIYQGPGLEKIIGKEMMDKCESNPGLFFSLIPEEDFLKLDEASLKALQTNQQLDHEYRLVLDEGKEKWVRSLFHVSQQEDGSIMWQGMIYDITESKEMAKKLHESERKYRQLAETAKDVIMILDLEGNLKYINQEGVNFSGYKKEDLYKMKILDVLPSSQLPLIKEKLDKRNMGDKNYFVYELNVITKSGRLVPIEIKSSLIVEQGKPAGSMIIARDITERKKSEEELHKRLNELEIIYKATLGREGRIIELKKQVNELLEELGRPPKYKAQKDVQRKAESN